MFNKNSFKSRNKLRDIVRSIVMNKRNANDTIIWIEVWSEIPNETIRIKMPVTNANLESLERKTPFATY
jgi:hypothetical protein